MSYLSINKHVNFQQHKCKRANQNEVKYDVSSYMSEFFNLSFHISYKIQLLVSQY